MIFGIKVSYTRMCEEENGYLNMKYNKRAAALIMSATMILSQFSAVVPVTADPSDDSGQDSSQKVEEILAFPGAEGAGRFASGGRAQDVYTVTNLEDYGASEESIPGSLRYGLASNRTIVFDVAGQIELQQPLTFKGLSNITIAGQTAPGDGITLTGWDTNISDSENLIIRYIRFRPGAKNVHNGSDSMDALWGRDNKTFMIDHCSFSFCTDECLSTYRGEDGTVQWSVVSESLTLSGHSKGRHGYGGIFGGDNVTFHHNLIADHTSRNPRIGGGYAGLADADHVATLQVSNNVIYNWGFNTIYGGGFANTNYVNNYLKAGPGTRDDVENRSLDAGESGKAGGFYMNGNYMEGNPDVTADNQLGLKFSGDADGDTKTTIADTPYSSEGIDALEVEPAENIYDEILNQAGAAYPKRDAIDARIASEVANGSGRYINREEEIGGYPVVEEHREDGFDADQDGMADDWEIEQGLNPKDPEDGKIVQDDGYSNLEHYMNSLVDINKEAENPNANLKTENNTQFTLGDPIQIEAEASSNFGYKIAKVEFFNGDQKIAESDQAPYICELNDLADGSYDISARATDDQGNETQTSTSRIHINTPSEKDEIGDLKGWTSVDIGNPQVPGSASLTDDTLSVKGSGKLGKGEGSVKGTDSADATKDDFHYVYQEVDGDTVISGKLNSITAVDNHAFSGFMIREDLDEDSAAAALGLSWVKFTNTTWSAYLAGRDEKGGNFDQLDESLDSVEKAASKGISLVSDIPFMTEGKENGYWMKLKRSGDTFTAYGSVDGKKWTEIGSREIPMNKKVYVGVAVDGNQVANDLHNLNTTRFSNVSVNAEDEDGDDENENTEDQVKPETIDPEGLLESDAFGSSMILNQKATEGKIPSKPGDPGSNISYLLFPTTKDGEKMSMDLKVTGYSITGQPAKNTGIFVGAFNDPTKSGPYATLGFRGYDSTTGSDSLSGYWIKNTGSAGNGSPKYVVEVGARYHVVFEKNDKGYLATFTNTNTGVTDSKQLKYSEMMLTADDEVSYGMALVGASAEVRNLSLETADGNLLYDQNRTYPEDGTAPTVTGITKAEVSEDRSSIDLEWTGEGAAGDGRYVVEVSKDGGKSFEKLGETDRTSYSYVVSEDGTYQFRIAGICKDELTTPVLTEKIEYLHPLEAPVLNTESGDSVITLTWKGVSDADSYDIYRSETEQGEYTLLTNVQETTYIDKVENEQPYYYRVAARNDDNTSNPSEAVFCMATAGHQGEYVYGDDAAVFTVSKKSDDTILSGKKVSLKGKVNKGGTVWLDVNGNTVKTQKVKAGKKFNFRFSIEDGSNDVVLYQKDARGNVSRKPYHFVGLRSYDMMVDAKYKGEDGKTKKGIPTFKSVQAAVSAVPKDNTKPVVIYIRNGNYYEKIDVDSPYISLIGQDSEKTVLYFDKASGSEKPDGSTYGTNGSASLSVSTTGKGFTAENMTISNTFDYVNSPIEGKQAVAFFNNADESIMTNVRFLGYQDTLYANGADMVGARQLYRKCYIEGNVDFIFGRAQAVFDDCDIMSLLPGYVTAASTEPTRENGFVFLNSRLYGADGLDDQSVYLARPWGAGAAVVYKNCYMDSQISDKGYTDMGSNHYQDARYAEYGSYGPGFTVTSDRIQLSKEEADSYTAENVFAADVEKGGYEKAWDWTRSYQELSDQYAVIKK